MSTLKYSENINLYSSLFIESVQVPRNRIKANAVGYV